MKIYIHADGVRLNLWFPLSVLKSRFGYKVVKQAIEKNTKRDSNNVPLSDSGTELRQTLEQQTIDVDADESSKTPVTREQVVEMYNVLKQCIKLNGHFNLVEVNTHDGEKVLIRV